MIIDINVLMYLTHKRYSQNPKLLDWFNAVLDNKIRIGIPYMSILGLVRLSMNSKVIAVPLSPQQAMAVARQFLGLPHVWTPEPQDGFDEILTKLMVDYHLTNPNNVMDAYIAALCIQNSVPMVTCDTGFRKFRELHVIDPTIEK
ncbi:MAG TPA: PIN domain-containing protein [Acidimicrobiia bacterium]|nr:PIN domain-containing protein [Acidimicrobiia bacterium]